MSSTSLVVDRLCVAFASLAPRGTTAVLGLPSALAAASAVEIGLALLAALLLVVLIAR